jgi:hypothetical protein
MMHFSRERRTILIALHCQEIVVSAELVFVDRNGSQPPDQQPSGDRSTSYAGGDSGWPCLIAWMLERC